jgi:HD-GYP domain-containing protein (c-di-GMP phosphodiesterase class II)
VTGAVFTILWLALVLLVRMASILMRRQTTLLRERSEALAALVGQLERSSLESIETLNATVDAKDPYTAGHSQRVQRVALAIGHELRLPAEELHALGLAGLFHDIGKIAVPDAILTKPGRLTDEEFEQMKLHPTQGARIIGKLEQLRVTVPLIRHHHERWDGGGYPDGLAGGDIPELATVVALADAWDAMTTDRPYAAALSTEAALAEVRAGRETQFAPAAVDAFLAVARTRPAELGISRAERVGALA